MSITLNTSTKLYDVKGAYLRDRWCSASRTCCNDSITCNGVTLQPIIFATLTDYPSTGLVSDVTAVSSVYPNVTSRLNELSAVDNQSYRMRYVGIVGGDPTVHLYILDESLPVYGDTFDIFEGQTTYDGGSTNTITLTTVPATTFTADPDFFSAGYVGGSDVIVSFTNQPYWFCDSGTNAANLPTDGVLLAKTGYDFTINCDTTCLYKRTAGSGALCSDLPIWNAAIPDPTWVDPGVDVLGVDCNYQPYIQCGGGASGPVFAPGSVSDTHSDATITATCAEFNSGTNVVPTVYRQIYLTLDCAEDGIHLSALFYTYLGLRFMGRTTSGSTVTVTLPSSHETATYGATRYNRADIHEFYGFAATTTIDSAQFPNASMNVIGSAGVLTLSL